MRKLILLFLILVLGVTISGITDMIRYERERTAEGRPMLGDPGQTAEVRTSGPVPPVG